MEEILTGAAAGMAAGMGGGAVAGGPVGAAVGAVGGAVVGGIVGGIAALIKGGSKSKPPPPPQPSPPSQPSPPPPPSQPSPPPPPPLFSAPWREISWGDKAKDLQYMRDFKLQTGNQKIRILLIGPVGAGKSSFINSVISLLRGRMHNQAGVGVGAQSHTIKYRTHKPRKEDGTFYPFVLSDIVGLEKTSGICVDDIILALKGHVKDNYVFKRDCGLSVNDPDYNRDPNENDKVHVLVFAVPANPADPLSSEVLQKMKKIRDKARYLDIPQMAIFTKVDECSPEIRGDLKKVYRDKKLKEKMEKFSVEAGFPLNGIFPVKNYHEENAFKDEVDSLILDALRNILDSGRDYIEF